MWVLCFFYKFVNGSKFLDDYKKYFINVVEIKNGKVNFEEKNVIIGMFFKR